MLSNTGSLDLVQLSTVSPEPVSFLWPGRIPKRKLSLLVGDPGLGKSYVALDIAARVTTRGKWPGTDEWAPVGDVIILSAEDDVADTIRPRFDAMGGDPSRAWFVRGIQTGTGPQAFRLSRDLSRLETAVREKKSSLVVIDPVTAYLGLTDSFKDTDVRRVLTPLAELATNHDVSVLGIMHLSKDDQKKAIYRASGSMAFTAVPRAVFAIGKDSADGERRMLATVKFNIGSEPPTLAYRLRSTNESVARVEWEECPASITADDLLGNANLQAGSDRTGATEEAREFLEEILSDGQSVLQTEVVERAQEAGISTSTLKRAKRVMGVKSSKLPGLGGVGAWVWELPKDTKITKATKMTNMAATSAVESLGAASGSHEVSEDA